MVEVSPPAGVSVLHGLDAWRVVYETGGRVYLRSRTDGGWSTPSEVAASGSASRPHVAFDGTRLHVVWEDSRSGSAEVYARSGDGDTWLDETCLTCDHASPARAPVIAADADTPAPIVVVAWESEMATGTSAVRARVHDGSIWGPITDVSSNLLSARAPSITAHDFTDSYTIVWSDAQRWRRDLRPAAHGR